MLYSSCKHWMGKEDIQGETTHATARSKMLRIIFQPMTSADWRNYRYGTGRFVRSLAGVGIQNKSLAFDAHLDTFHELRQLQYSNDRSTPTQYGSRNRLSGAKHRPLPPLRFSTTTCTRFRFPRFVYVPNACELVALQSISTPRQLRAKQAPDQLRKRENSVATPQQNAQVTPESIASRRMGKPSTISWATSSHRCSQTMIGAERERTVLWH